MCHCQCLWLTLPAWSNAFYPIAVLPHAEQKHPGGAATCWLPFPAVQGCAFLRLLVSFGLRSFGFLWFAELHSGCEVSHSNTSIIEMRLAVTVPIMKEQMNSYLLLSKLNTSAWPKEIIPPFEMQIWYFAIQLNFSAFLDRLQLLLSFLTVALWGREGFAHWSSPWGCILDLQESS